MRLNCLRTVELGHALFKGLSWATVCLVNFVRLEWVDLG